MKGVNYLLALGGEKTYDIERMKIKRVTWKEFEAQYNENKIDERKVKEHIDYAIRRLVLPEYEC